MAKTVWKFKIPDNDESFLLRMPVNAQILHVASQFAQPMIWALVDPDEFKEDRSFKLMATGERFEEIAADLEYKHIGSFLWQGGREVWHLFEIVEKQPYD